MNYFRKSLLLIVCLTLWSTGSLSADDRYSQSADGMTAYIGILPAEMIREHRVIHQGHEGITTREQHLIVTVVDEESGQRIEDAEVAARIRHEGHAGTYRSLEPMSIADTITYGNFFSFPEEGGYHLQLRIKRSGEPATEMEFHHRHVLE